MAAWHTPQGLTCDLYQLQAVSAATSGALPNPAVATCFTSTANLIHIAAPLPRASFLSTHSTPSCIFSAYVALDSAYIHNPVAGRTEAHAAYLRSKKKGEKRQQLLKLLGKLTLRPQHE